MASLIMTEASYPCLIIIDLKASSLRTMLVHTFLAPVRYVPPASTVRAGFQLIVDADYVATQLAPIFLQRSCAVGPI